MAESNQAPPSPDIERVPTNPQEAYDFFMQIRDLSTTGLSDEEVVRLASEAGLGVVEQMDRRYQRGDTIVRNRNLVNPAVIASYSWMMPQNPQALDRLALFLHKRVVVEQQKPETERNKQLLGLETALASKEAEIKRLYLSHIELKQAENIRRMEELGEKEELRKIRDKRISFLNTSRFFLRKSETSADYEAYKASLEALTDDELEKQTQAAVAQATDRILNPILYPDPQTEQETRRNEQEVNSIYILLGFLVNVDTQDFSDEQIENLLRQRVLKDLNRDRADDLRLGAMRFSASLLRRHSFEDRFALLFSANETLRYDIINHMLDQLPKGGLLHLERIVEFCKAIEEKGLSTPEGYYQQVETMLKKEIAFLSGVTHDDTQFTEQNLLAFYLGELASDVILSYIRRGDLTAASNLIRSINSVISPQDMSGLQARAISSYYSSLSYRLMTAAVEDRLRPEIQSGIYAQVISQMDKRFITPEAISYLWRSPDTLVPRGKKLSLLGAFHQKAVYKISDIVHLNEDLISYTIFESPYVPAQIKSALYRLILNIRSQKGLTPQTVEELGEIINRINRVYKYIPTDFR